MSRSKPCQHQALQASQSRNHDHSLAQPKSLSYQDSTLHSISFAGIDDFGVLTIVRRHGRPRPVRICRGDSAFGLEQRGMPTESPTQTREYFGPGRDFSGKPAPHFRVPASRRTVRTVWDSWTPIDPALHLIDR